MPDTAPNAGQDRMPTTAAGDVVEDGFIKRVVPPGPQPEPQCPTGICSICFPGEPCIGSTCPVCGGFDAD